MSTPRPYRRPMTAWWRRDPYFVRYMWREMTALGVGIYAVVLTVGAWRLAQGDAAWNAWLAALRSPWSLALHALLLLSMVGHAQSWVEVMPRTMPAMHMGGRRVAAQTITRAGWAATVVATVVVLALLMGSRS